MVGVVWRAWMAIALGVVASQHVGVVLADTFYLPGVDPLGFLEGDQVPIKVNAMTSMRTLVPKDPYRFPFCKPPMGPLRAAQNLGQYLTGNLIQSSPYFFHMKMDVYCATLCRLRPAQREARKLQRAIHANYHHHWIVDNLPSAYMRQPMDGNNDTNNHQKRLLPLPRTTYGGGFPLGYVDANDNSAYIYNHLNLHLQYHIVPDDGEPDGNVHRIVAFAVEPLSLQHSLPTEGAPQRLQSCPPRVHMDHSHAATRPPQRVDPEEPIIFTYDVIWHQSTVPWEHRWDVYLHENHLVPFVVHWNPIFRSVLMNLLLSILLIRTTLSKLRHQSRHHRHRRNMETAENSDEAIEQMAQRLLQPQNDLQPQQPCRPKTQPLLFAVLVGSGVQLAVVAAIIILLSFAGHLNPARRGYLPMALLVFFTVCSPLAGYTAARLYKAFQGRAWQQCTLCTATLYPGLCFAFLMVVNVLLFFHDRSPGSVPLLDLCILAIMWCAFSIPLVMVGSFLGYKRTRLSLFHLAKSSSPSSSSAWPLSAAFRHYYASMAIGGMLPFSVMVTELSFIMGALWMGPYYYVFGVTLIVYSLMLVTCVLVTLLLCHYGAQGHLQTQWWFSFLTTGSTGLYVFAYSVVWFFRHVKGLWAITHVLYFGYMFLLSLTVALITGAVGVLSWLWFLSRQERE